MDIKELELRAKEYVELEADTKVKAIKYSDKFVFLGSTDVVFSISSEAGDFWVVGGDSPMNLYDKSKFSSADEAFSFHLGLMSRISERQMTESDGRLVKINQLLTEGQSFVRSSNFSGYDSWKRKVQFFVEKIGTSSMIKEVEKEVNHNFIYIASLGSPSRVDRQKNEHQKSQLKNLLSILTAIGDQLEFESGTKSVEQKEDLGYDFFLCHAYEDKQGFVKDLAEELSKKGAKVWYDDFTLKIGDSLRRKIDHGLANSKYGVVILSHNFFSKEWPQKELDGLTARESEGKKVVLPVWYNITKADILKRSPTLADKVAADSSKESIPQIAQKLMDAMD